MEPIDSMKEIIQRVRGVLTAYNTNIDVIVHVDGAKIKRLLREKPEIGKNVAVNLKYPPREILEEIDVVAGLLRCMKNGTSEEWIKLDKLFKKKVFSLVI